MLCLMERDINLLSFSDIWLNNSENKTSRAVLSYSWKLRSFADYVQQLEMESLGKQPYEDSNFKKNLLSCSNFITCSSFVWKNKKLKPFEAIKKFKI